MESSFVTYCTSRVDNQVRETGDIPESIGRLEIGLRVLACSKAVVTAEGGGTGIPFFACGADSDTDTCDAKPKPKPKNEILKRCME